MRLPLFHQMPLFNEMHDKTAAEHEKICAHPKKSGAEVMVALDATETSIAEERKLYNTLMELLSYEKIIFNGMLHWDREHE